MNNMNSVNDLIERYIYQVTKHLTTNRSDIEKELKSLITDMIEERTMGKEASQKDVEAVLLELGNPAELADGYRDNKRHLIGSELFPHYLTVLKIVLFSYLLGMIIFTIIDSMTSSDITYFELIGSFIGNIISGGFMAFGWVTIIFAILEWKGVKLDMTSEWTIETLPPVPLNEAVIKKSESISSLVFSILFGVLFLFSPQLLGIYININGDFSIIPIFNLAELARLMPLLLIGIGVSIFKYSYWLMAGRYSIRLASISVVCNIINLLLLSIVFSNHSIWYKDFASKVNTILDTNDIPIDSIWNSFTKYLLVVIAIVYIIDSITITYKSIKYSKIAH